MSITMWIIAAASLLAQIAFFVGFYFLSADLLSLRYVIAPEMREGSLFPYIRETIASYQAVLWTGLIGAVICGVFYFKKLVVARWFMAGARVLAWLWILLIPISTVAGIVLVS